MKKTILFCLFMAALAVRAQSVEVFFFDDNGKYTNIRNAPNGKIVEKVSTESTGMLEVEQPVNGWWVICDNSYYDPEIESMCKLSGARNFYVHYSCIAVESRNYAGQALSLRATPSSKGKVVYSFRDQIVLRPMDVKGVWVKVKTYDGKHTGWIEADWLCGSSMSNCN